MNIGDSIYLSASRIKAACIADTECSSYQFISRTPIVIRGPLSPLLPTVSLSVPPMIGSCDDMTIDPTASVGQGGRPWHIIVYTVKSENVAAGKVNAMTDFLQKHNSSTSDVLVIPQALISPGIYQISLQLTNFLFASSSSRVRTTVTVFKAVPIVSIVGPSIVGLYRWQPLTLFASARLPPASCAGNLSDIDYSWTISKDFQVLSIRSSSKDSRYFSIPAYMLDVSSSYIVQVTAMIEEKSTTAQTVINVGVSGINAVIAGGSIRSLGAFNSITLDASTSSAIDYPGNGYSYLLNCFWSCMEEFPMYGADCLQHLIGWTQKSTFIQAFVMNNSTVIPQRRLRFTAKVSFRDGSQVTEVSTLATITGSMLPTIVVENVATKYNVNDKITLDATVVSNSGATRALWESTDFDMTSACLTPTSFSFSSNGEFSVQLGIKSNFLSPGLSYRLTFKAAYGLEERQFAASNIVIVMNSPPSGGYVSVSPESGEEMLTSYNFRALLWQDDPVDYPLQYTMSYYQLNSNDQVYIKPKSIVSSVQAFLSRGLPSNDYYVTALTIISDSYGSTSNDTVKVRVAPVKDVNALVASVSGSLESAFKKIDTALVSQLISGATNTMNSVNCTIMLSYSINKDCITENDCSTCLNRDVCSKTAHTCGSCLPGFFGLEGDSNSPCMSSVRPTGAGCRSNIDCLSGLCDMKVCRDPQQTCPNGCSQKGACVFYDLFDQTVSDCTVSDETCSARCSCQKGSYGKDCSMTSENFNTFRKMRENLCVSMYASTQITDVTADVISSRANSVLNILKDPTQVSTQALTNCSRVLLETMFDIGEGEMRPEVGNDGIMTIVSSALSKILDYGNSLPPNLKIKVEGGIANLTVSRLQSLAVDEPGTAIKTSSMRLFTSKQSPESLEDGASFDVPRSSYETINNQPVPSVTITTDTRRRERELQGTLQGRGLSAQALSPVGVSLIQYNKDKGNNNSTALTVQATYTGSQYPLKLTLLMINKEPMAYFEKKPVNKTVICLPAPNDRQVTHISIVIIIIIIINITITTGECGLRRQPRHNSDLSRKHGIRRGAGSLPWC